MSEPLMPLVMFHPAFAPVGAAGRKRAHIWPFSLAENGVNSAQNFAEIQQNADAEFLHPYMGLFWSEATAFFSKSFRPLARLLKNGNGFQGLLNFSKLRNFSKNGNASSSGAPRFAASPPSRKAAAVS